MNRGKKHEGVKSQADLMEVKNILGTSNFMNY